MSEQIERTLRALWRDKMHVEQAALDLAPLAVRVTYEHIWQPAELLLDELCALPEGLLSLWQRSECGHVVFTHRESVYRPGAQSWRGGQLEAVCYISIVDLRRDTMRALLPVFHYVDHLLGSWAAPKGPRLSDGAGISIPVKDVGQRFVAIQDLHYGHQVLGVELAGDYWAHTFWLYLKDGQRLNTLDPLAYKLYHNTIFRAGFFAHLLG